MLFLCPQGNYVVPFPGDMSVGSSLRVSTAERGLDIFSFGEGVYQESLADVHAGLV